MPESPLICYSIFDGIERIYINARESICAGTASHSRRMRSGVPKLTATSRAPDPRRTESDHFPYHHWRLHLLKRQMSDSVQLCGSFS